MTKSWYCENGARHFVCDGCGETKTSAETPAVEATDDEITLCDSCNDALMLRLHRLMGGDGEISAADYPAIMAKAEQWHSEGRL